MTYGDRPRPEESRLRGDTGTTLYEDTIAGLLARTAAARPEAEALVFREHGLRLTWGGFREAVDRLATGLLELGVARGDRVGIWSPNRPEWVLTQFATARIGAILVNVNPAYRLAEVDYALRHVGVRVLVTADRFKSSDYVGMLRELLPDLPESGAISAANLPDLRAIVAMGEPQQGMLRFDDIAATPADPARLDALTAVLDPNDPINIQFTSGTTGLPKGVTLTHSNVGTNCRQVLDIIHVNAEDKHTFISLLPFFHVYGLTTGLIIPIALAATTLPLPRYVPQDVLRLIAKYKPTVFPGAPSVYISLLQQKNLADFDLRSIQICVSGSAPLPREIFRKFQETTGAAILEGYGLTEASPITHCNPLGTQGQRPNSIGMPVPGTDARIVDMEGGSLTLPPGKMGELIVQGPQVMHGYWRRPDESASALRNGWLYTGDLATMDEDGYFYIVDRKKDMVIVGGYNVYPREVDEVLLEHPKVIEAVCVGITDDVRGEILKAFVVRRPGEELTKADVIAWCRQKLAGYKVPRLVEFRDELPKSMVGKVLRRVLQEADPVWQAAQAAKKKA